MDVSILNEKEKTELYYTNERLCFELRAALRATRDEPGLSLKDISNIIKKVFATEEIEQLIRELKQ